MKNSDVLQKAKEVVDSKLTVDGEVMSAKQIVELQRLSKNLEDMRRVALGAEKKQEIKDFLQCLDNAYPLNEAPEEDFEAFYQSVFTIGYKDRKIELVNCAELYQGIYDLLVLMMEEYY